MSILWPDKTVLNIATYACNKIQHSTGVTPDYLTAILINTVTLFSILIYFDIGPLREHTIMFETMASDGALICILIGTSMFVWFRVGKRNTLSIERVMDGKPNDFENTWDSGIRMFMLLSMVLFAYHVPFYYWTDYLITITIIATFYVAAVDPLVPRGYREKNEQT